MTPGLSPASITLSKAMVRTVVIFTTSSDRRRLVHFDHLPSEQQREADRARELRKRVEMLSSLTRQLQTEIQLDNGKNKIPMTLDEEIWRLLHPKVTTAAKMRFEASHYADAVESAFKELNSVIKDLIRKKTQQELDGAALMQKAFSPNQPLIALDDLSQESGRNIQQGYMQIYAGAMTGIRNPKAHANLIIGKERCLHLLFLASLLFHKFDERI
jgi:uncharacterized protein (TIGR02391 family)